MDWEHDGQGQGWVRRLGRMRAGAPALAALYESAGAAPDAPLLLTQHGGSSHKCGRDVEQLVQALCQPHQVRLASLDGPVHGSRCPGDAADAPSVRARFFDHWGAGDGGVAAQVADWRELLDRLLAEFRPRAIVWVGMSMGTAYGLPLVAQEPRIARAVLGMWGTSFANSDPLLAHARATACPVLWQMKWDDELFDRPGQLALFDALGSADKRLHAYTGGHVPVAGEQMADLVRFALDGIA